MNKVALLVEMTAKPGKEEELARFLTVTRQPMAAEEPYTVAWFAIRLDQQTFVIFDVFEKDADLQTHLNGQIPATLMARVEDLLTGPPQIRPAHMLAEMLPAARMQV
jgi:quinol monooxygenase YgiN